MYKFVLMILTIAMLFSLATSLKALFKEQGQPQGKSKTLNWLIVRVVLAVLICVVVVIGFFTGELTIGAPWTGKY